MSTSSLNFFLDALYNTLTNNQDLKNDNCQIYMNTNTNPVYPFISIKINQISDHPSAKSYGWQINFCIAIFFRQNSPQHSLQIAEKIDEALSEKFFESPKYKVISMQKQNGLFCKSKDGITSKFVINYLSFIRQK